MDSAARDDKRISLQYFELTKSDFLDRPIDVPVTGTIPTWLEGSLYRNGSGLYKVGDTSWKHAFDGFSVLHRWTINDGKVSYLARILDSEQYEKCVKLNRLAGAAFGSNFPDPCKSIFWRFFSHFVPLPPPTSDNTAVNIVEFGDRLFALTETTLINEIDPKTLLKKGRVNVKDVLAVHMGTAHPHKEKDGTMYYFGTNMKYGHAYNFVRVPRTLDPESPFAGAQLIGCIPSRWRMNISYTHSFGMTENYFVHLEQPFVINFPKILTLNMRNSTIAESIICFKNQPIDFHIISKTTGKRVPITYRAPFGFVFHFVNCFEESGFVVCDVVLYEQRDIIHDLYVDKLYFHDLKDEPAPVFARYVLPLSLARPGENLVALSDTTATAMVRKGTTDVVDLTYDKVFGDTMLELPRINYNFNGNKYRYVYGSTVFRRTDPMLVKLDLQEKTVAKWEVADTHIVGEPVFIPTPETFQEDSGVVLCPVVSNSSQHSSYLVVLDAETFTEIGRATTPSDVKMSFTLHGTFVNQVF